MLELNEKNFESEVIASDKPVLVFFYRESGCSFCDKMKPIFAEYALKNPDVKAVRYKLGQAPDSVNLKYPIERFPTFYAFVNGEAIGKQEGAMPLEQLALTFTPELITAKPQEQKKVTIASATLVQLLAEESNMIDSIFALRNAYTELKTEISKRKAAAADWDTSDK